MESPRAPRAYFSAAFVALLSSACLQAPPSALDSRPGSRPGSKAGLSSAASQRAIVASSTAGVGAQTALDAGGQPRSAEYGSRGADLSEASIDDLVQFALENSPELRAAQEERLAEQERGPQVRALPDPRLGLRYFLSEVETRVGPQEFALGIHQRFPWPRDLALAGGVVDARTEAAGAMLLTKRRLVARRVRVAWTERWELERRIEIVAQSRTLFETLEEVLRSLYASGKARYGDLARTGVELGRLRDRERGLLDRRRVLEAYLRTAMGLSPDGVLPAPGEAPPAEALTSLVLAAEHAQIQALTTYPALTALTHQVQARELELQEAQRARRPELTLGIEWISTGSARMSGVSGSGDDPLALNLQVDLPFNGKRYSAKEREARARLRAAGQHLAAARDELVQRLEEELYRLRDAERRVVLYDQDLIPQARDAFEATQSSFHAGGASFTDVVDTERVSLELQLELARARADHAIAQARVWELAGEDESKAADPQGSTTQAEPLELETSR